MRIFRKDDVSVTVALPIQAMLELCNSGGASLSIEKNSDESSTIPFPRTPQSGRPNKPINHHRERGE